MYDSNGRLTLDGAKAAIAAGGSVLIGGQLHNDVRTLPSAVQLSTANAVTRKDAEDAINAGGKFSWHGKTYSKVADLPDAEEFEAKNREARDEAREQLRSEIQDRQKQLEDADRLAADAGAKASQAEALRSGRGPSAPTVASADELHEMTVPELKAQADAIGVEGTSGMTKDELVKAIRKQQKAQAKS